jgi:ABC-type amino acid transport system permease subunit
MDWYHLVLFVHILGVLGLFMAFAVELAIMMGARSAHTVEEVRAWSSASKLLDVVFPITSLLILGAGLAMTIGFWGWSHAWIDLSLGLLILLSFIGAVFNGSHARRIAQRAAALGQGAIPPDFRRELNHPMHWTSVVNMATLGLSIVFLMVVKPDWLGSIITLVVALLVGVILAQVLVRSGQARVSSQEAGHIEEQATSLSTRT